MRLRSHALTSNVNEEEQYILRVPTLPEQRETNGKYEPIRNDVTLLGYLQEKLAVPRVKAYCITRDNALKAPFTLQTRIPGASLDRIYGTLDQTDKLAIIDQVVELIVKLESIRFPKRGVFVGSSPLPDKISEFLTDDALSINVSNEDDSYPTKDARSIRARAGANVKSLLASHLQEWIAFHLEDGADGFNSFIVGSLRNLLGALEELDTGGTLSDQECPIVLHHVDLEPRNIMVENRDGKWKISGIIDWDDALALPRPLARRPPNWIWDWNQDICTGYWDADHHPTLSLSRHEAALKAYFDRKAAAALKGYLEDVYTSSQWLRRIWFFARYGIRQCFHLDLLEKFEADWSVRIVETPLSWMALGFRGLIGAYLVGCFLKISF